MKVLMLRNPAANVGCRLEEGETGDVPDNMGRVLVSAGLAKCLDPPPETIATIPAKSIEAVPPDPIINESVHLDSLAEHQANEPEEPHTQAERDLKAYVARQKRKPKTDKDSKS